MENKKKLVEKFYNDYYLGDYVQQYRVNEIEFNKQGYFVFQKLMKLMIIKILMNILNIFLNNFLKKV